MAGSRLGGIQLCGETVPSMCERFGLPMRHPVAQTLSVQNVVGGTTNTAGVNWTFAASRFTGNAAVLFFRLRLLDVGVDRGNAKHAGDCVYHFRMMARCTKSVKFANLPAVAKRVFDLLLSCTIASPCASGALVLSPRESMVLGFCN